MDATAKVTNQYVLNSTYSIQQTAVVGFVSLSVSVVLIKE